MNNLNNISNFNSNTTIWNKLNSIEFNIPTNTNSIQNTLKVPKIDLQNSTTSEAIKASKEKMVRMGSAVKRNDPNAANNFCSNTNYSGINYDVNNDLNETNFGHSKNRSINSSTLNE